MSKTVSCNVVEGLRALLQPVSDLAFDPRPHRIHPPDEIEDLKASLSRYGMDQPLVVQREGMIVRVGNGRLEAARELGWTHVAAIVLDRAEAEMVARAIMDNRVADKARTDRDVLAELLGEIRLEDPTLPVGFTDLEIRSLVESLSPRSLEEPEEENPPEEPARPTRVARGDLWILGDHRVLCGDSTVAVDVERLAGDLRADQILTDPPYGVSYGDKAGRREIANDQGEQDYRAFFAAFLRLAPLSKHNTTYVFMSGQELHSLRLALDDAGFTWGDYLVWVKDAFVLGRKDYNAGHEFVAYGWKGSHRFHGDAGWSTTVLSFDRPRRSTLHPTMKPTELLCRLLHDGSTPAGVVYDPFLGSGSTLIACEMSERRCLGIEIDPAWCEAAIGRWERFTGRSAERA